MYNHKIKFNKTSLTVNEATEGEPLEIKIERMISNKEKIDADAPIIYTERKEGVRPSTNIRTDRFDIAIEASDKISRSYKARREGTGSKPKDRDPVEGKDKDPTKDPSKGDSGAKPTQGTDGGSKTK